MTYTMTIAFTMPDYMTYTMATTSFGLLWHEDILPKTLLRLILWHTLTYTMTYTMTFTTMTFTMAFFDQRLQDAIAILHAY